MRGGDSSGRCGSLRMTGAGGAGIEWRVCGVLELGAKAWPSHVELAKHLCLAHWMSPREAEILLVASAPSE